MPLLKSFRLFITTDISSLENALAAKLLDLGEVAISIFSVSSNAGGTYYFADESNVLSHNTTENPQYACGACGVLPNRVNPLSYNLVTSQIPILRSIDLTNAGTLVGSLYAVLYNPNGHYYMCNNSAVTPPFNGTAINRLRTNDGTAVGFAQSPFWLNSVEGLNYFSYDYGGPFFGNIDADGQIIDLKVRSTIRLHDTRPGQSYFRTFGSFQDSAANLATFLNDAPSSPIVTDTDPYHDLPVPGDEPIPGGGTVAIPGFPGLTATSAGVIGLFCPTAAQMQLLADFMWTDFGGTGSTVEDILKEIVEALKRTISNPLDYIIGLNIIPSQGLSIGATKNVRFGFVDSGVAMPILANQYFTVDCGALSFDAVCGGTFLDYAPYSKFSIYLPYIGFKDVDPNDFVGHSIGVVYHGDCVTGGVTAYITKDGSVMYQYSGCCALNVPLSADNWGETISGAISVATGIVAAAASGGAAGVGLAAAKGAASVAANPSLLSPQVNHSGAISGGAGCMGVQYPFVIREAVNFHSTENFNKESGYPAYYYKDFSEVTGFTTILDPHIANIPQATQGEINEIETLLESGVIL